MRRQTSKMRLVQSMPTSLNFFLYHLYLFISRRVKIKTEKAMYAEKVGGDSSGDLR